VRVPRKTVPAPHHPLGMDWQRGPSAVTMSGVSTPSAAPKSLPLILARELASNLATPMFLIDASGVLVYYNDAAAILLGRPFGDLGEIPAEEFGAVLELATPDGERMRRRDSPAGIALFEHRPAHAAVLATSYNGVRREYEATAYPLFGATGEMHGVISVFWEDGAAKGDT
jgi:PAS domain-containing protein